MIQELSFERFESEGKDIVTAITYRNVWNPYQLISVKSNLVVYERTIPREIQTECP